MGGMNEAGLVVETMALPGGEFPKPDSRPFVNRLQWRQYQLDNFATVEELIGSNEKVRIAPADSKSRFGSHYLVCDKRGECAAVDFIDGKMVVHTGETMPVSVLTNHTYAESLDCWEGGRLLSSDPNNSINRFVRTANLVSSYDRETVGPPVDYAFEVLKKAAKTSNSRSPTMWSIVYDQQELRVYIRTAANSNIRVVDLKSLDFSCTTPVKVLDINTSFSGDLTKDFHDYTQQINHNLIHNSFRMTPFLERIPQVVIERYGIYPESTVCRD
jgi:choloylglycine hydrolase